MIVLAKHMFWIQPYKETQKNRADLCQFVNRPAKSYWSI